MGRSLMSGVYLMELRILTRSTGFVCRSKDRLLSSRALEALSDLQVAASLVSSRPSEIVDAGLRERGGTESAAAWIVSVDGEELGRGVFLEWFKA